jgi:hypothetical protein
MFVPMVAVVPPLLSDHPPELPQQAGLGDRFHYFRGRSGRRYLFSVVERERLADFRNAVVMVADRASGRLAAQAMATLDAAGRPGAGDWPFPVLRHGVLLVHLLAHTAAERRAVIADLAPAAIALRLAA